MKIHQLPDGARFEYEGEEYTKTGPLSGTGRHGQRLIPRYAVLKPLGDVPPPAPKKSEAVSRQRVMQAFEAFYAECATLVPAPEREALASARERFVNGLD